MDPPLDRANGAVLQVVDCKDAVSQKTFGADKSGLNANQRFPELAKGSFKTGSNPQVQFGKGGLQGFSFRNDELCCSGWCRCPQVRDKIRYGIVGFMTDGRDDGNPGSMDRPGKNFGIERLKILKRASPAGNYQHIGLLQGIGQIERCDNFVFCALALNPDGDDLNGDARKSSPHDLDHIVNDRTAWRGDDAYPLGQEGQGLFERSIKQPFLVQPRLELFEGKLQRSPAFWLHRFEDELVLPLWRVNTDSAHTDNAQTVFESKREVACLAFEEHGADLRLVVFEREIKMT